MRKAAGTFGVMALGLLLMLSGDAWAAKGGKGGGKGKNKPGVSVQSGVSIEPASTVSPVTDTRAMNVCVTGFEPGSGVSIHVPWGGSPDYHSVLSFGQYVDQTGGFCITCPPDWTELRLDPGTYTVKTTYIDSPTSGNSKDGPQTTFQIQPSP